MVSKSKIKEVAERVGIATNAEAVILFGSYARGNPTKYSDVDLMIIAENALPRFKRTRELYKLFNPHPFGMDLIVYTPKEVKEGKKSSLSFVSNVLKEGETLYVRRNNNR
jgi:predicted nucleotidyltransferase